MARKRHGDEQQQSDEHRQPEPGAAVEKDPEQCAERELEPPERGKPTAEENLAEDRTRQRLRHRQLGNRFGLCGGEQALRREEESRGGQDHRPVKGGGYADARRPKPALLKAGQHHDAKQRGSGHAEKRQQAEPSRHDLDQGDGWFSCPEKLSRGGRRRRKTHDEPERPADHVVVGRRDSPANQVGPLGKIAQIHIDTRRFLIGGSGVQPLDAPVLAVEHGDGIGDSPSPAR